MAITAIEAGTPTVPPPPTPHGRTPASLADVMQYRGYDDDHGMLASVTSRQVVRVHKDTFKQQKAYSTGTEL